MNADAKNKRRFPYTLILILITVLFLESQLYQIDREPFGYHEFDVIEKTMIARNMIEYGKDAAVAPVINVNPLNDRFIYYLNHPYLNYYFIAPTAKIFRPSFMYTRTTLVFLFLVSLILFFYLVSSLWNKRIAAWTCFFFAFLPTNQYFSKIMALAHPFFFAFVLSYYLWIIKKNAGSFLLLLLFFLLSAASSWMGFFLAPIAVFHYRYILNRKGYGIFLLLFAGLAAFAVHSFICYSLTGSFSSAQSQWPSYMTPTYKGLLDHTLAERLRLDLLTEPSFYSRLLEYFLSAFTFPVTALILLSLFGNKLRSRFTAEKLVIFFIPGIYICYGIIFSKMIYDHMYCTALLTPGVSATAALAMPRRRKSLSVLFAALFLVFAVKNTHTLYSLENTNHENFMLGKVISAMTEPLAGVAVDKPFSSPYIDYSGRKILYDVTSWKKFDYMAASGKISCFITDDYTFQEFLINRHPALFLPFDYILFDMKKSPVPAADMKTDVLFDNDVRFTGFDFRMISETYALLHYEWKITSIKTPVFKIFVHFEDQNDRILFGHDHYLARGFTVSTDEQGHINERYVIKIPETALEKTLRVYIGLFVPGDWRRVKIVNTEAQDDRYYLGAWNP